MILEKFVKEIDFKPYSETVDNQRRLGSCVAFGTQNGLEVAFKRAGITINFSPMDLYYYVQKYAGTLGTTDGGRPDQIGEIVKNHGVCLEQTWPYHESLLGIKPSVAAQEEGKRLFPDGTVEFKQLNGVRGIKQALNRGQPVYMGMVIQDGFQRLQGKNWREHEWDVNQPAIGLHLTCCIGYSDDDNRFLSENSWGPDWGDGGYYGCKYEYVGKSVITAYTFTKLPVPIIPVEGYIPESIPLFDSATGRLEIPSIAYAPGGLVGGKRLVNVILQLYSIENLIVDDVNWVSDESYYIHNVGGKGQRRLGLSKLEYMGTIYDKVTVINPVFDLIQATEEP
jgi:hypothetical protein